MKNAVALVCLALTFFIAPARAEVEHPVPVSTVPPVFPTEMRREHINGLVMVSCLIDLQGRVQEPKVEKASNEAFAQPAVDALKKWRFKPAQKDGTAVAVRVAIPVKFTIED